MAWVGRDLRDHQAPTPLPKKGSKVGKQADPHLTQGTLTPLTTGVGEQ